MASVIYPQRTIIPTEVTLPDVDQCVWSTSEDTLTLTKGGQMVGWITSSKEIYLQGKHLPDGLTLKQVLSFLVDAYQAMKQVSIW